MKTLLALLAAACTTFAAPAALAQKFPDKPIRFIVPFPPGGGNDILARAIAPKMGEFLGQPVVIDNRAGAGGNIGTDLAAKSAPDGYTIVIASNQVTINPWLYAKLPFDIEKDFAAVAQAASVPMVLAVHPSVPANTLKEFIALAKASPGKFNHGTPGNGTPQHIAFEVFNHAAGVQVTHIAYKGTGPAIADLIGGQV
ncbi:MAG: tripartite tricarboxylate transporter substrate binding protein, partial [Betaproteobacteria bacterium]|nr:tripartite tricarboxylate transporter substrate binding protein [Betaproteobacteria bacterium]